MKFTAFQPDVDKIEFEHNKDFGWRIHAEDKTGTFACLTAWHDSPEKVWTEFMTYVRVEP